MADQAKVKFISIEAFKDSVDATSIEVLKNPKTGKLFMTAGGDTYRVQQDIDPKKEMRILIPLEGDETGIENACLVNVSGGAETQFTL